jgi:hypothetical protein
VRSPSRARCCLLRAARRAHALAPRRAEVDKLKKHNEALKHRTVKLAGRTQVRGDAADCARRRRAT